MTDKDYGVVLTDCKFKKDASLILMDRFALKNDDILTSFQDFCESYDLRKEDPAAQEKFVSNYEDEDGVAGDRFEGLLARVINDAEFDGEPFFIVRDYCLYVSACVPVDDEDKAAMPTQKDIQRLLAKYLNPLLEKPTTIDWVDVYE